MPKPTKAQTETVVIFIWPCGMWMYSHDHCDTVDAWRGNDFIEHTLASSYFEHEIDDIAAYMAAKQ